MIDWAHHHKHVPLMRSTFAALRKKMTTHADHPRYQEQTFKEHAQAAIRAGHQVQIWARDCGSYATMMATEDELNRRYQGLWTKEGRSSRGSGVPSV